MRTGLHGMPTVGKTYLLNRISFIQALDGSGLLRESVPDFDGLDGAGRENARRALARLLRERGFYYGWALCIRGRNRIYGRRWAFV